MSRVGKLPITVPSGVTVTTTPSEITVAGSKGTLSQFTMPGVEVKQEGEELIVTRDDDTPKVRARHGLMRALLSNMITGVSQGFTRKLEINGVGYRASLQGADLKLSVGLSHEVAYKVPEGVQVAVEQNTITVSGIDRQKVGQVAAEIRAVKKPEPYKGKGIRYEGERILRKSGKSGKEKQA